MLKDSVYGKRIHRNHAHTYIDYKGVIFYLCCPVCQAEFQATSERWSSSPPLISHHRGVISFTQVWKVC